MNIFRKAYEAKEVVEWFGKGINGVVVIIVMILTFVLTILLPHIQNTSLSPGDLTPLFGKVNGVDRVRNVRDREENTNLIKDYMLKSQDNLKIVTIDGATWLLSDLYGAFKSSQNRINVTVLMMDFSDKSIGTLWNYAMRENGTSTWDLERYKKGVSNYEELMGQHKSKMSVGMYNLYPWTRFTIFDDHAVSFIVTPNIRGIGVPTYFSEDPFIVECFENIFNEMKSNAEGRGRFFLRSQDLQEFVSKEISQE